MIRDQAETERLTPWRLSVPALALVVLLCACGAPSTGPESEIRGWLDRGVAATEAKERGELMDMISPAYADARGYNRARVGNILRAYFLRMNKIETPDEWTEMTVNEIEFDADLGESLFSLSNLRNPRQ